MRPTSSQRTARWRGYGDETPIGKWIRNNPDLPSRSDGDAFSVSNNDLTIHAYMHAVDSVGTREIQSIIRIEWKSHGKKPDAWQLDTLFKEHCGINRRPRGYLVKGARIINHGIYVCVCSGSSPEDSDGILWGRFRSDGFVEWSDITLKQLNRLLRFDINPKTFRERWLRRHHTKRTTVEVKRTPLGFDVEKEITVRS